MIKKYFSFGFKAKSNNFLFTQSKKGWFKSHINDPYVKKATQMGLRSRAAFKLQEIENKYHVIGQKVLDLGSAPGSWSQMAQKIIQKRQINLQISNNLPLQNLLNNKQQQIKIVAIDILQVHFKKIQFFDVITQKCSFLSN